jgi:glycosyltransferase involved in cell wall biosynthesis
MKAVSISIIICTRNRADSLRQTLTHLDRCAAPPDMDVELLVVDNGSTDHTRQVVEQTTLSKMPVRYVLAPRTGLVHARNQGINEAKGDIILFTDDDIQPSVNWIEAMCRPIFSCEADATMGTVICDLADRLPVWYDQAVIRGFAEVNLGGERRKLSRYELVGANMAFSKSCVDRIGYFNTLLGAGRLGFFDDTEFSWRLDAAGFTAMYCPEAVVFHYPVMSRLSRRSLRREWFRHGFSAFVATSFHNDRPVNLPLYRFIRQLIRNAKLTLVRLFRGKPYRTTQDEMFLWMSIGTVYARALGIQRIARKLNEPASQPPRKISNLKP